MATDFESVSEKVDQLTGDQLDKLGFGAVQLNSEGKVLNYNRYESELAGLEQKKVLGKNFFTEVAPCTKVKEFYGEFMRGVKDKKLDVKFKYHFPFKNRPPTNVMIIMHYSSASQTTWVFVQPTT